MYQLGISTSNTHIVELQKAYGTEGDDVVQNWLHMFGYANNSCVVLIMEPAEWREYQELKSRSTVIASAPDPYAGKSETLTHTAGDDIPRPEKLHIKRNRKQS